MDKGQILNLNVMIFTNKTNPNYKCQRLRSSLCTHFRDTASSWRWFIIRQIQQDSAMDQVIPKRVLKLTAQTTQEEVMMAYDEWAKAYEEVHSCNVSYKKKWTNAAVQREMLLTVDWTMEVMR